VTGRRILLIALLWLGTVAGASALTWGVISSAGEGVGQPSRVTVTSTATGTGGTAHGSQSWSGNAGRVTATCTGDAISLDAATPNVGYFLRVHDRGPERLRVDFESKDNDSDGDEGEVIVVATCVDGRPDFHRQ